MFGLKGEGHRKAAGVSPVSVLEFAGFVTLLLTFVYYFAFLANKLKLFCSLILFVLASSLLDHDKHCWKKKKRKHQAAALSMSK